MNAQLSALLAELEQRGAASRTAPTELREAYAAAKHELLSPGLFSADVVAAAQLALQADLPRHEAALAEERRKDTRRRFREQARRERRQTQWAKCCTRLYHRDARPVTQWTHCLSCKAPLRFQDDIPDLPRPVLLCSAAGAASHAA